MTTSTIAGLVVVGVVLSLSACTRMPDCTPVQAGSAIRVDAPETAAHRLSAPPLIDYAPGAFPSDASDFQVQVLVDASGRVVCHVPPPTGPREEPIEERQALLATLGNWRYAPFERNGHAVAVIATQAVAEQERPRRYLAAPDVPLADVSLSFVRGGCFDGCPEYAVTVRGDGRVGYVGKRYVDVEGRHAWRIPPADVAALVAMVRDGDVWSANGHYRGRVPDAEWTLLRLDFGAQRRSIHVYDAEDTGLPPAVKQLQEAIERVSGADERVALSTAALDGLIAEGFDVGSAAAGDLLARALFNRWSDAGGDGDAAMLRLIESGAPLDAPLPDRLTVPLLGRRSTIIEAVLERRRTRLVAPLLARGVLLTNGQPDQAKVDAAVRAAVAGGRLAPLQRVWAAASPLEPAREFVDEPEAAETSSRSSLALALEPDGDDHDWEGYAIARWLADQGVDLKATRKDGSTLLHLAAEADDEAFFRWLLERGVDPLSLGERRLAEVSERFGDDTAQAILDAVARRAERRDAGVRSQ